MKTCKPGDKILCTNIYTGRTAVRTVTDVSKTGKKVTVERLDWATGRAVFNYAPSFNMFRNEYSAEMFG